MTPNDRDYSPQEVALAFKIRDALLDILPGSPGAEERLGLNYFSASRKVLLLVREKCREVLAECPIDQPTGDEILSRVLGSPS